MPAKFRPAAGGSTRSWRSVKPDLAVALGATAAQSLLGKAIPVTKMRGEVIEREDGLKVFITIHPSFILRIREPADKEAERARFLQDMREVKRLMAGLRSIGSGSPGDR